MKKQFFKIALPIRIMYCLKVLRDDASFPAAERPFEPLAPLKEKRFCPFFEFLLGSLKVVAVFLQFLEVSWDVPVKRLHICFGACS